MDYCNPYNSVLSDDSSKWADHYLNCRIVAYIDGACANNGQPNAYAGIGVYWDKNTIPEWDRDQFDEVCDNFEGKQSNQRAELIAARTAIETVDQNLYQNADIYTDSDYVYKSQEWTQNWMKNGWKDSNGRDVANKQDFIDLYNAIQGMNYYSMNVRFIKVKAHDGIEGNERADTLAKMAAGILPYKP